MRWLALIMAVAACTLDPQSVLSRVALRVHAFDLPEGGELRLSTTDSRPQTRTKKTKVLSGMMEILYEEGSLAPGPVTLAAEAFDAQGVLVGCGTARGVAGEDAVVIIGFASPSTNALNCGTCGNRCETDVATGSCVAGRCTAWECPPGLIAESDGGCNEPVVVIPDAGPPPDAGPDDGGMMMMPDAGMDGGTDAGVPVCMPVSENTDVACSDGADNDCDLRTDCADLGCLGLARTCTISSCGREGTQTWDCATRTWSPCLGDQAAEATMAACKNGIDDDCDGQTDCADEVCDNIKVSCGVDICAAGVKLWNCNLNLLGLCLPHIPIPETNALLPLCSNGLDDDCDNRTDCLDTQCRGRSCGGGRVCCADGGCSTGC